MRLAFVTNNAARTPERGSQPAARTRGAGPRGEVITSPQAAAHYLRRSAAARGRRVLVVGTDRSDRRVDASAACGPVFSAPTTSRRRWSRATRRTRTGKARRGRGRHPARRAVGRDQPRRDRAVPARTTAGQRLVGRGAAARDRRRRRWRPASPIRRCTGRPSSARARNGRSSSGIAWTPTSRAPTRSAARACSSSPA